MKCYRCKNEAEENKSQCKKCLANSVLDSRKLRQFRKENNLCLRCGRPKDTETTKCQNCLILCRKLERQHDREIKQQLFNTLGGKCACCGEKTLHFLTIDHINGGGRKHREETGKAGRKFYQYILKNLEESKKQVRLLCYNCNCGRQHNKGICPHQEHLKNE